MRTQINDVATKFKIIDQFLNQAIKVDSGDINLNDFSNVHILGFDSYKLNSEAGVKVAHTLREYFDQSSFYYESEAGLIILYEIFSWLRRDRLMSYLGHMAIVGHLMKAYPNLLGTTVKFKNYTISFSIPMCIYEEVGNLTSENLETSKIAKLTMEEFMNVNVSLTQHTDDAPAHPISGDKLDGTPIEDKVERIIEETEKEIVKAQAEPKELKEVINVSSEMGDHTIQFHKDFLSKEDRDKFLKDLLKIL